MTGCIGASPFTGCPQSCRAVGKSRNPAALVKIRPDTVRAVPRSVHRQANPPSEVWFKVKLRYACGSNETPPRRAPSATSSGEPGQRPVALRKADEAPKIPIGCSAS